MKYLRLFLLVLLVVPGVKVSAQSYFLVPENFYLKKGDKLNMRILITTDATQSNELKYNPAKTEKFILQDGKKKTDLAAGIKDTTGTISVDPNADGILQTELVLKPTSTDMSRNKFLRYLGDDDPDKITDKVKSSNQLYFKEKYTCFMKTLFYVDKSGGNTYEKPLDEDLEIILQQNPYKFNYGDDVTAVIKFKGKPIPNIPVQLYVKTAAGAVFPQKLSTDASGLIYFKLSREGIYLLSTKHSEVSADKSADFETWRATYSFAFSSSNELPNTYREFGFGDKH